MNSLVAILSTIVSMSLAMLVIAMSNRLRKAEEENKVLWGQIKNYDAYIAERAHADEEMARAAIRN